MADDFIDRLRTATFPTARRGGYDTEAVDAYLRELADWLETGGTDQTRAALIQREMERVGERTGGVLSAAQKSANGLLAESKAEAAETKTVAEREAGEARSSADEYSLETRRAADEHVRLSAEAAAREASDLRARSEAEAQEKIGRADARLQEAETAAAARTAGIKQEIAGLVKTRDGILENLEELTSSIRGVVDGPSGEDLELPEGLRSAIAEAEEETGEQEAAPEAAEGDAETTEARAFDPQSVQEHVLPPSPPPPAEGSDDTTVALPEDETVPIEDGSEDETTAVEASGEIDDGDADYDTDEQERARERELERRRNPTSDDPPTEDSDLSDPFL